MQGVSSVKARFWVREHRAMRGSEIKSWQSVCRKEKVMGKVFREFLLANNITSERSGFSGLYRGLYISGNISVFSSSRYVTGAVHLAQEAIVSLQTWLQNNARTYGFQGIEVTSYGFYCSLSAMATDQKIVAFLGAVVDFLNNCQGATLNACPFCGESLEGEMNVRLVGVNGCKFRAHEQCFDSYAAAVQKDEAAFRQEPTNAARGALGAVIGALVGCVLWWLLYQIGFIAVIAAIATAFAAAFLWDKFGGKNCKLKIVIIWLVTTLLLAGTMLLCYLLDVSSAMAEVGVTGSAFDMLIQLMRDDAELRAAVLSDTVVSLIFIVAGNVWMTVNVLRSQKKQSSGLVKY